MMLRRLDVPPEPLPLAAVFVQESPMGAHVGVLYRDDDDPGVHSASRYLLHYLGEAGLTDRIDAEFASGPPKNPRRLAGPPPK